MQKIQTSLWFDDQALEAAEYYVSVFDDAQVLTVSRYGEWGGERAGSVLAVDFELAGQRFNAINGGPMFQFSEATSLTVNCVDQAEIDRYWDRLLADGGTPSQCGWLKDKYGFSWQIVPVALVELAADPERQARAMAAMMTMVKLDLAALLAAADGA